ncbi:hypothetical protein CDAR_267741 [Caerostris darwini]|uniref:Zinc finger protein 346 n=2 Tax=Caerostris darwini TaxID=1538125 RepID=A0AAV4RN87_9ARAC|nr:hypothetical protein CDAR_267741 [Caerostris darwini]
MAENDVETKHQSSRCKVCKITFEDIYAFADHLQSKKHIKEVMKNKYADKYLEAKAQLDAKLLENKQLKKSSERTITSKDNREILKKTTHANKDEIKKNLSPGNDDSDSSNEDNDDDTRVYHCEACMKDCIGSKTHQLHLQGKKHLKNVKKLEQLSEIQEQKVIQKSENKTKEKSAVDKKIPVTSIEKPKTSKKEIFESFVDLNSDGGSSSSNEDSDEEAEVYTCEVCEKICTGSKSFELHLQGKKHRNNVKKIKLLKEMKRKKIIPQSSEDEHEDKSLLGIIIPSSQRTNAILNCKTCNKSCVGPEAFKQHCKSTPHKKKLAEIELLKNMEAEGLAPSGQDDDETVFARCDVCDKKFSGPLPYTQHMKSSSHLKQAGQLKAMGGIKDLFITKEEDSKIYCKECGKMFSGPVPFNTHLKSSVHGKLKKKSSLLDTLEKKHPELIKTIVDDEDNTLLGCKVCHVSLTGPEVAKDHFSSTKHKKAVAKKVQFKALREKLKNKKLLNISDDGKNHRKPDSSDSSSFESEFDIISEP